jgi:CBS domain containing-hemolysin-like protein
LEALSTDSWLAIAVAVIAFVIFWLAAFVELSLATVNRLTLRELIEERAGPHHVQSLIDRPQVVRSTMQLLELISAVVIAIMLTGVLRPLVPGYGTVAAIAGAAVLIIIARGIARAVASTEHDADSPAINRIARPLAWLTTPAVATTNLVARILAPLFRRSNGNSEAGATNGEEREHAEENRAEALDIEEDEQEMISGVLSLEDATAREIMVPRMDIIAVPIEASINDVVDIVRMAGHSRIPVFRETIDAIVGMVYAKDLLRFVREAPGSVKLLDQLRPAYFVPESKRVDELLKDLQQEKVHLAIVVDEYGGTAGLVTIEDILEEIVGEIQDEYDREVPMVERMGAEEVLVDGRISLDEIGEIFETEFPDRESGTIGGFVQRTLGRIPKAGESVRVNGLLIEVRSVEHHRIRKLRVVRAPEEEPGETERQAGAA